MLYNIQDGTRTIRFDGSKLAHSSSWRPGSARWIEFALYRTDRGTYVLHRVGISVIFHTSTCPLVKKYGLHESENVELSSRAIACEQCGPEHSDPIVFMEQDRNWVLTTENPEAVIESLYKEDDTGTRYLTKVAERLLEQAVEYDAELDAAYRIVYIL